MLILCFQTQSVISDDKSYYVEKHYVIVITALEIDDARIETNNPLTNKARMLVSLDVYRRRENVYQMYLFVFTLLVLQVQRYKEWSRICIQKDFRI